MVDLLTQQIIIKLRDQLPNIHILRYDAVSSDSVYLKLDYGVGYSIRVSDHHSHKNHLKYRYNVLTNIRKSYEEDNRIYVNSRDIQQLVNYIVQEIKYRRSVLKKSYYEHMEKNKKEKTIGFWVKAYEVPSKL